MKGKRSLCKKKELLEEAEGGGKKGVGFGLILGGILGEPIGLAVGGATAMAAHRIAVSSAEQAVNETSNQVTRTQRRFYAKETELRKLKHEQEDQEKVERSR